jgi:hypothetical protein
MTHHQPANRVRRELELDLRREAEGAAVELAGSIEISDRQPDVIHAERHTKRMIAYRIDFRLQFTR